MRSGRLARALLRLYPRAWRARYGDEFLALVAELGLSWRGVPDVVVAAFAERVRAIATLIREEDDPALRLQTFVPLSAREILAESGAFFALIALTVGALFTIGVPYSTSWSWWLNVVFYGRNGAVAVRAMGPSWAERVTVSFVWFLAATSLTGLAWMLAALFQQVGVPAPTDGVFESSLVAWAACIGCRVLYCGVRTISFGSTWQGMHRREIHAWRIVTFAMNVFWAVADPSGRLFWGMVLLFWMSLRPPFEITRAGAAVRRARHEALYGAHSHGVDPPA